jgi:hypothetical protein
MPATQRLYKKVAADIAGTLERSDVCKDSVALVTRKLADNFKFDNSRFRYDTFFEACGLDGFGYVKGTSHETTHENFVARQYADSSDS